MHEFDWQKNVIKGQSPKDIKRPWWNLFNIQQDVVNI